MLFVCLFDLISSGSRKNDNLWKSLGQVYHGTADLLKSASVPLREPKPLRQAPYSADGALLCISSPSNSLNRRPQVLVGDVQGVVGVQESMVELGDMLHALTHLYTSYI